MLIKDILKKMDSSKRFNGTYNNEILCHMPTIESFIRKLETMSLEEFYLLQAGIEPVEVDDSCPCERCIYCTDDHIDMCESCMVNGHEYFEERV